MHKVQYYNIFLHTQQINNKNPEEKSPEASKNQHFKITTPQLPPYTH